MKKRVNLISIFLLITIFILTACSPATDNNLEEELEAKNNTIKVLEDEKAALEERILELESVGDGEKSNSILSIALEVVEILKNKDMSNLSTYIHPSKGVRFSPYGYIDVQTSQVFNSSEVASLMEDNQIYTWGSYDGTGDPIDLNFNEYFEKFVYDKDFANPHMIGNNLIIGTGNSLNNIQEVYPNGEFVEFHFTGFDTQYEGMDWESLKLVFEQDNGRWYLVGIVHDQWTI